MSSTTTLTTEADQPNAKVVEGSGGLLLEVPDIELSGVRELVRTEMCGAYPLDPPLAVDIGVGDDWREAKS